MVRETSKVEVRMSCPETAATAVLKVAHSFLQMHGGGQHVPTCIMLPPSWDTEWPLLTAALTVAALEAPE